MSTTLQIFIFVAIISSKGSFQLSGYVDPAVPFEYPFAVSIARRFDITANNPFGHTCGGALLSKKYVLTAATCFLPGKTEKDYFVYVGSNDLANANKFEIESWISYDSWLKNKLRFSDREPIYTNNDIGIVEMSSGFFNVAPVKVSNLSPEVLVGRNVKTAGWGLLFDDTPPQYQLKADLRVISNSQCLQNIRNASNDSTYSHEDNFFCTNGAFLFAVLDEGDKGSPVFLRNERGDYRIVGVNQNAAPWVNEIVRKPEQQNVHLNVFFYIDFIRIITRLRYL